MSSDKALFNKLAVYIDEDSFEWFNKADSGMKVRGIDMKRMHLLIGAMFLLMVWLAMPSVSAATSVYEKTTEQQIAKGLVYQHRSILTTDGWVDLHVFRMDLNESTLSLDILRNAQVFGLGDRLTDMLHAEEQHVAGINASFFSMGTLIGEVEGIEGQDQTIAYGIDDYNYYSSKAVNLSVDNEGIPSFDFLKASYTVTTASGNVIRIQGVNTRSVSGDPVIFNRLAYDNMSAIDALRDLYKVVVSEGKIVEITKEKNGLTIPEDGYIMVFPVENASQYLPYLNVGASLNYEVKGNIDLSSMQLTIPGGGYVIKEGIPVQEGLIVGANERHPRTVIGTTEDLSEMIFLVIDGRGYSIGANHSELQTYMAEYGVYNGIYFDGGGSSTMAARSLGELDYDVLNTPSDGHERSVVNGLGIVSTAPTTEHFTMVLKSDQSRVFLENKVQLSLYAYDDNYNPVTIDPTSVTWQMSGGYGKINDAYQLIPKLPGKMTLTASYQGITASLTLTVVDELIDLEIVPKVMSGSNGTQSITVIGTDTEGYKSVIDPSLLNFQLSNPIGTIENGIFIPGSDWQKYELTRLDVTYQGIKEIGYIVSGEKSSDLTTLSTLTSTSLVYPLDVEGASSMIAYGDSQAIAYQYRFEPLEAPQAVYAQFESIYMKKAVDKVALEMDVIPDDLQMKAILVDAHDISYTITFESTAVGMSADVPNEMTYPVKLSRLYVVSMARDTLLEGEHLIYAIKTYTNLSEEDIDNYIDILPKDSIYSTSNNTGFNIKIFGATGGRNRLLDQLLMDKVYQAQNQGDYAIFGGSTNVDDAKLSVPSFTYAQSFKVIDEDAFRLISLNFSKGSLVKSDVTQWVGLSEALARTTQNVLIIMGTESLIDNSDISFVKEAQLIHSTLKEYARKSGKTIYYINASGYSNKLMLYEGIRYIDLNGLWYKVDADHMVDLYDSFQLVNLYIDGDEVTYNLESLYPKVVITQ